MTYKLLVLIMMVAAMVFGEDKVASVSPDISKCTARGTRFKNIVTVCSNVESSDKPLAIVETSTDLWQICEPNTGAVYEYFLIDPYNIPEDIVCTVLGLEKDCKCEASAF